MARHFSASARGVLLLVVLSVALAPSHRGAPPQIWGARLGDLVDAPNMYVIPDGLFDPDRPKNSSGHVTTFDVINNGTTSLDLTFTCMGRVGVTCTNVNPGSATLAPSTGITVNATYSVGDSGGRLVLRAAEDGPISDTGWRNISTPPTLTLVVPALTPGKVDTAVVYSRTPLVLATYRAPDAAIDTTSLVVKLGNDTVTPLTRRNRRLVEWEIDPSRQLQPGVVTDLYVRVCHTNSGCTAITRRLRLDNSGSPIVSFSGMPLERSSGGAEVETGIATPAYYSLGVARSAGLVYSTRQSYPRALVNADIELTWPAGNPDTLSATLLDGATPLDSLRVANPVCQATSGRECRVTLQGDFSGTTFTRALRKWLIVKVRLVSAGATRTTTDSVEVVLVDRRASAYGSGWFVAGVLRLDSAVVNAERTDRFLVGPTGAVTTFRGSGGYYLSPPGDRSVLSWTGTAWHLLAPARGPNDAAKLIFDAQGRHTQSLDAHGNSTTVKYGAVDRVDTIIDPVGKKLVFLYSSGTLTTIRDPGSRDSKVTVDGSNRLVYDSLASPPANSQVSTFAYTAYGGNNTYVLASWSDALGQGTTVSYDARRRPHRTTLPSVLPDTGSTALSPELNYRAQVLRGLDTLLSADSVFDVATDPRGHWTRSVLNRWGLAERTWDALGTLGRAAFDVDGRVVWSEGKVADSTRVHFAYDTKGRLLRSFRRRTASDTVLLDSVVYHATYERATHRFNALRQATVFTHNNWGDVLTVTTPTSDVTTYQYAANGQVSQVQAPLQSGWTVYAYDATWKNLGQVNNANGVVMFLRFFDGVGRDTLTRRKRVTRVADTTYMRWERTITKYLATNQVDSIRTEVTNECTSPCNTPPAWPTAVADSQRWQHVKYAYDRLGRDTARLNTRDQRTRYSYDGLGRLRARWPFADSTAIVDSFRYDLAGNLRYHRTRRGTLIEHRLDGRGRDTITIVPGVGDYHRVYAGPNDELTRLTIGSYADSIGGVNPNMSWVYNQSGQLLSDTSQGTRVATYLYDRFGRDTLTTDVRGTTRLRYDAVRGLLDSLLTPYGDTLRWTIDARWRRVGPYVQNGADPDVSTVPTWDQTGKLTDLVTSQGATTPGAWRLPSDEPLIPDLFLVPQFTDPLGTAEDSLGHDGWGRVTSVRYRKNSVVLVTDTLEFDRDGNIDLAPGFTTYDVSTTRLLVGLNGYAQTYDRAGNLTSRTSGGVTYSYQYDALDRLVVYRENGTLVARYAYDALGRRIVKRVFSPAPGHGYLRMIYRGDHVVAETDSVGSTLTLGYVWGLGVDNVVAVRRYSDSQTWYTVQDVLHSVRGLTRRDGTWAVGWRYRIYGTGLDSSGTAPFFLRYRWIGREFDQESGLYYFRSRYYDPRVARFVQEDAIGFAGGPNLYAFGDGNPTNGRDSDGLMKNGEALVARSSEFCMGGSLCQGDTAGDDGASGWGGFTSWVDQVMAYNDAIQRQWEFQQRAVAVLREHGGEGGAILAEALENGHVTLNFTNTPYSRNNAFALGSWDERSACGCVVDLRPDLTFNQTLGVLVHEFFLHAMTQQGHAEAGQSGSIEYFQDKPNPFLELGARTLSSLRNAPGMSGGFAPDPFLDLYGSRVLRIPMPRFDAPYAPRRN